MTTSDSDRTILRDLARQVAEIGALPIQEERRQLWKQHNSLTKVKNMVLIFPENSWNELLPRDGLVASDDASRGWEWHFRHVIYHHEYLRDDFVIEPRIDVGLAHSFTDWGVPFSHIPSDAKGGAWKYDPPIKDPDDFFKKVRFPELSVDEKASQDNYEQIQELFGDILTVRFKPRIGLAPNFIGPYTHIRGLDQMMLDMADRPDFVREVMSWLQENHLQRMAQVEENGWLSLNNEDDYVSSGGVGYTDELPAPGFDGTHVRLRDLWGFSTAQELSLVSPEMHYEFVVKYEIPVLAKFGLNCYGCCEALHHKLDMVKRIPRLRRLSISPWADVEASAKGLGSDIIFSWKPRPADLAGEAFDADAIRSYIQHAVDVCEEHGCILEMIMKDTHTIRNDPKRAEMWTDIAQEVAAGG